MNFSGLMNRSRARSVESVRRPLPPAACGLDRSAIDVIWEAPIRMMLLAERLLLFTLTFALRPERYLEIGTLQGGSALITCAAMDAVGGDGRIVCVDPRPQVAPETWARLAHRATLIAGFSPEVLPGAQTAAGGTFDLVLIDGDHTREGVVRDAEGVLPFVSRGAKLLFHDSHNDDVHAGIEDFLAEQGRRVMDFGTMTREGAVQDLDDGSKVAWGGFRMVEVRR